MKRVRLFLFNALLLSLVNLLMRTVAVSFNAYVSVKVGAEGMGLLSLVMSVYGLAVTVASSGVYLAAVRLTAQAAALGEASSPRPVPPGIGPLRVRSVMGACLVYSLLFGSGSCLLLLCFSRPIGTFLLGDARTIPSLRVLALSLPAISLSSALGGYFTGMRKVYKNVAVAVLEQTVKITLTAGGLLLLAPSGLEYACLAVVGGAAVSEAASLVSSFLLYLPDRGRRRAAETGAAPPGFRRHFRAVAGVALPVAFGSYARQGLVSAEHLAIPWGLQKSGAGKGEALASYGVLHGMVFPLLLFPSAVLGAFSGLLVPEMAACAATGQRARINRIAACVLRCALVFAMGTAGIFSGFAWEFGTGLYHSEEAARFLRVLAPLIPVMYLDSAVDGMLKGLGEQMTCMKINLLDSSVSLVLVLLLVPRLGVRGYLISVFVCELMNATLSISRLLTVTGLRCHPLDWVLKPLAAVILSVAAVRLLASLPLPLVGEGGSAGGRVVLCVLFYLVLLAVSGVVRRADWQAFRRATASAPRGMTPPPELPSPAPAEKTEARWQARVAARFVP